MPKVNGLHSSIYFIDHACPEKRSRDDSSKSNPHEAEYLVKLCEYLVKQKYEAKSITVLSMYLGQLCEIRALLHKSNLKEVKVSTVDNYQGEKINSKCSEAHP